MNYNTAFKRLSENSITTSETVRVLEKIASNILKYPSDLKYRTLQKNNVTIQNKVISVNGGVDCLKLMGFQENETSFVLPTNPDFINKVTKFKNELSKWSLSGGNQTQVHFQTSDYKKTSTDPKPNGDNVLGQEKIEMFKAPPPFLKFSNEFLQSLVTYSLYVRQYENKKLQERAKKLIPISDLEMEAQSRLRNIQEHVKKNKLEDPDISIQDTLLLSLLRWFKEEFFDWVDSPPCEKCDGKTTFSHMSNEPNMLVYTNRVEMHKCQDCGEFTPFARYNDLNILLETRKGRCGEWANTFTLFCRSMGWDARFVVCEGDHVWTEVYSVTQKRWLHCDACENICDTPLVYENGWKKPISYVISYSAEEIQDVTWRYSSQHKTVMTRRNKCSESELLEAITKIRAKLWENVSQKRKDYLTKRLLMELVEFLVEKKPGEEDQKGRISGGAAWRIARKEISETSTDHKYIWIIHPNDIDGNTVTIRYSSALNRYEYISGNRKIRVIDKWNSGTYENSHVFRKEEKDWNMVYLARTEGEEFGKISWKIDLRNISRKLSNVSLNVKKQTFENGFVNTVLRSEEKSISLPPNEDALVTNIFANSKELTLESTLYGGKGDVAWQHSQLFRQSLNNTTEYPFSITLAFDTNELIT